MILRVHIREGNGAMDKIRVREALPLDADDENELGLAGHVKVALLFG